MNERQRCPGFPLDARAGGEGGAALRRPNQTRTRLIQPAGLADMLLYRLHRLRTAGGGMVLRYCEGQFGITRREWVFLGLLDGAEPVTCSELAERAGLQKSATSKTVVGLLRKGLVSRLARQGDRRYAQLALTQAGREMHARILPLVQQINQGMVATLSEAEIAQLDGLLDRMQEQVNRMVLAAGTLPAADRRRGGSLRHHR